uniref:Uncharacterized protein n=1 Tax=Arundo donax TaxID=35708 RepID=A0A0A9BVG2_ARUDO
MAIKKGLVTVSNSNSNYPQGAFDEVCCWEIFSCLDLIWIQISTIHTGFRK